MRAIGVKHHENGWTEYRFNASSPFNWQKAVMFIRVLYDALDNTEILISITDGSPFQGVNITKGSDIINLPESSAVKIRGKNKAFDNSLIQFFITNNTDIVCLYVMTDYINSLGINGKPMSDNSRIHVFDRYMDIIEMNTAMLYGKYMAASDILRTFSEAIVDKNNFTKNKAYIYDGVELPAVNLTAICEKVVDNWREVQIKQRFNK